MSITNILKVAVCAALLTACNSKPVYQNTKASPEKRAKDLVSRLTLEQKVSLMQNSSPAIPEFGIKQYDWWNEALHGVGRAGLATVFPQSVGMAASFDDALLLDVFTAVSDEARAKSTEFAKNGRLNRYQGLTFWTPNVNIFRDPRWGRGQETYGEDPFLSSRLGVSVVNGLQGPADSKYDKLHACAKHFAVHSGPEWNRHSFNAENIEPRDLRETYLPAFKSLVQEADVKEVMCAYNRYEDDPCCGSSRLLQQILRDEWGYKGIVVSDCWAINDFFNPNNHGTEPDAEHATSKAVITGTDLECGSSYSSLIKAVEQGLIEESQIDLSITRLMKARFELGEMDAPEMVEWNDIPYSVVASPEHKALALKMAQESMVLLKNEGSALPLRKSVKVAVIGPNANDSVMQWGNYNGTPQRTSTLLAGVTELVGESNVIYDFGCDYTQNSLTLQSLFNKCSAGGQQGFSAKYWNNTRMEGNPDVTRNHRFPFRFSTAGATVFAPGVNLTDFSAEYTAVFTPDKSADVAFYIKNQGNVQIYVDGERVAFSRGNSAKERKAYTLKAKAGKRYDIKLTFACTRGDAALSFDLGYEVPVSAEGTVAKVSDAQVVVFAGGISPSLEGEEMPVSVEGFRGGDRTAIELPKVQVELVKALKKAGKKVIFVNYSGSAVALTDVEPYCDAILQAWYPGQEGGKAVASVLFGDYNPSGKLPVTFYKSTAQLPDFEDYSMKGRTYRYMTEKPLYEFGYGLSYSTFSFADAKLSANEIASNGRKAIKLTVPVTNTSSVDGEEVVQVYVSRKGDIEGPSHALRGFKRVAVKAGETKNVEIELTANSFEWFDTGHNLMRPIEGEYAVYYGNTSDRSKLKQTTVTVK